MRVTTVYEGEGWDYALHGGGLAVSVKCPAKGIDLFFQDEDAAAFMDDVAAIETVHPTAPTHMVLREACDPYLG